MELFMYSKGVVLGCKRSRFRMQKESFWVVKGVVLSSKRSRFESSE